jgi:hypothetical protein
MKTVFTKKEGVKMNTKLDFGSTININQEFEYLMTTEETIYEEKFTYYYRITDDKYIQLAYSFNEGELIIIAQYKLKTLNLKDNIKFIVSANIKAHSHYHGFPKLTNSVVFNQMEFDDLIRELKNEKRLSATKASHSETPIISFLRMKKLNPTPSGNNPNSWVAQCPSGGSHFIMVVTKNDEWGCGYCKRKGKLPELKKWIQEIKSIEDQKMLSRFMKESGTGKLSEKVSKWWINRY